MKSMNAKIEYVINRNSAIECWHDRTTLHPTSPQSSDVLFNFYARQHTCCIARICHGNSVCPSVCPSHGWISQKQLKLGSRNFHRTVAPSL